jgi:hypothetical protein
VRRTSNDDPRLRAAAIAVLVTAVLPAVQFAVGVQIDLVHPDPLTWIAPLAVPTAGLLAWRHTAAVLAPPGFEMLPVVVFATEALLVGATALSGLVVVAAFVRMEGEMLHDPVTLFLSVLLTGIFAVGAPVFVLAWIVGTVWALLLRATTNRHGAWSLPGRSARLRAHDGRSLPGGPDRR